MFEPEKKGGGGDDDDEIVCVDKTTDRQTDVFDVFNRAR